MNNFIEVDRVEYAKFLRWTNTSFTDSYYEPITASDRTVIKTKDHKIISYRNLAYEETCHIKEDIYIKFVHANLNNLIWQEGKEYPKGGIILINKIYNEDCLSFMKKQKDNSINLIIADVPYNIGKDYGNDSDKTPKDTYIDTLKAWVKEFHRILTNDGTLFVYTGKQFNSYYRIEIDQCFDIKNDIVWHYDSSGVQAKTKYGSLYEPIIYATKDKKNYTFNTQLALVEAKTGSKRKLIDYRKNPPQPYNTEKVDGDVWYYTRVRYKMPEYTKHPTQKPLSICERIIDVHSNKGDIVYIPFAGSGSEIEMCMMKERNWIATELNNEYIEEIIKPRIVKYIRN